MPSAMHPSPSSSCQDFARNPYPFTLAQQLIQMMLHKQGTKTSADLVRSGMGRPQSNARHLLVDQFESSGNGPHLRDESHDAVLLEARRGLAQPTASPQ